MVIGSMWLFLTFLLSVGFIDTLHAATLVGIPNLLDGDTIEIENQVIRLEGIDAPGTAQLCQKPDGRRLVAGRD